MTKACVYWLHLPEHNDMFSEGYIGVSVDVGSRFKDHIRRCKSRIHKNPYLNNVFEKYEERLVCSVILVGTEQYCYNLEQKLRPNKRIGWNLAEGGNSGPKQFGNKYFLGKKHTEETKDKLSKSMKGRTLGKKLLEETKVKMRVARQKQNPPFLGKQHSEETKQKMSKTALGKTFSDEHKKNISNSKKGQGKGTKWWNNGLHTKKSKECPGDGWILGRTLI